MWCALVILLVPAQPREAAPKAAVENQQRVSFTDFPFPSKKAESEAIGRGFFGQGVITKIEPVKDKRQGVLVEVMECSEKMSGTYVRQIRTRRTARFPEGNDYKVQVFAMGVVPETAGASLAVGWRATITGTVDKLDTQGGLSFWGELGFVRPNVPKNDKRITVSLSDVRVRPVAIGGP